MANPFSTRFTRPGRIVPLDADGLPVDVDRMVGRFDRLGGSAAIVGPHGSGKSNLLVHLAAAIGRRGRRAVTVRVRARRDVPAVLAAIRAAGPGGTVCIDGWECLGCIAGGVLRSAARVAGRGLLVTSHRPAGFTVLFRSGTSARILRALVATLSDSGNWLGATLPPDVIDAAFAGSGGNLREALYWLYDRYEARTRPALGGPGAAAPPVRPGCGGVPGRGPVVSVVAVVPPAGEEFMNP